VGGVGRGMGVLDGGGDRRRGRAVFWVNWAVLLQSMGTWRRGSSQITLGGTCCFWNK